MVINNWCDLNGTYLYYKQGKQFAITTTTGRHVTKMDLESFWANAMAGVFNPA